MLRRWWNGVLTGEQRRDIVLWRRGELLLIEAADSAGRRWLQCRDMAHAEEVVAVLTDDQDGWREMPVW